MKAPFTPVSHPIVPQASGIELPDPGTNPDIAIASEDKTVHVPQYHVIILDDDAHTYDYVIEMLMDVFNHSAETAYIMACEVDAAGRVIVNTTHKDRAELKRDQIHSYGADWRMKISQGSMSATIEPAE